MWIVLSRHPEDITVGRRQLREVLKKDVAQTRLDEHGRVQFFIRGGNSVDVAHINTLPEWKVEALA